MHCSPLTKVFYKNEIHGVISGSACIMFSLWKEVATSMEGVEKVSEDFVTFWLIFLYYLNTIYHVYVLPKSRNGGFTH